MRKVSATALVLIACLAIASPSSARPSVFAHNAKPFGFTYEEWVAKYYQWSLAFPLTADPETDTAPATASQSGPVWFIPTLFFGGEVTRSFVLPAGTALFIPVLAIQYDNGTCDDPTPSPLSLQELQAIAASDFKTFARVSKVTLDGQRVRRFRIKTGEFSYTVASHDNAQQDYCIADGATVSPATAVGRFAFLRPLDPGQHSLVIDAVAGPPKGTPFFVKKITYNITVQ